MYLPRIYLLKKFRSSKFSLVKGLQRLLLVQSWDHTCLRPWSVVGNGALRLAVGGHGAPHALRSSEQDQIPSGQHSRVVVKDHLT